MVLRSLDALLMMLAMLFPQADDGKAGRVDAFGDPLPPEAVRRIGSVHFRQGGDINELIAAPDGKTLISCTFGSDRKVCVWESTTGRLLRRLPGDVRYTHMALSAKGTILAVGGREGIGIWEPATGRELHRFKGDQYDAFFGVGLSPDGKMLASCDQSDIHLWNTATGAEITRLAWPTRCSGGAFLAFTPDGKTLIAEHIFDPKVRRWDVATRRELDTLDVADGNVFQQKGSFIRKLASRKMADPWRPRAADSRSRRTSRSRFGT